MFRFMDPFDELERTLHAASGRWRSGVMPMDAFEKDGTYFLRFDLPGVDPDNVDLTVEKGTLTVTAERTLEDTVGVNWLLRERPTGIHSRQIRLGDRVDTSHVHASYENGVLEVTLPMRADAKPRKIEIAASAPDAIEAGAIEASVGS